MCRKVKSMKYLVQGMESKRKVELLISLTSIKSEPIIAALTDHLVRGFEISEVALLNDTKQGNVSRALDTLNEVAATVEKIYELKFISV